MSFKTKTAALIVIGNEILTGRTQDKNVNYIAKQLFINGILLNYVCIIPDKKDIIIDSIKFMKNNYDFIITTGGIGPTHDDITSESIAKALDLNLEINNLALRELEKYYQKTKLPLNEYRKKMAFMPVGSKIIKNKISGAPGYFIENIYVFPGIPKLVLKMFKQFLNLTKSKSKFYKKSLITYKFESEIVDILQQAEIKFKIKVGSYPKIDEDNRYVEIVLVSINREKILKAANYIKKNLLNV